MPFSAFDPVNEESSNEQAVNVVAEIERLKKSARPEVASRIAEIYRSAPYIPPAVILSMAKAGVSDQTVEASKKAAAIKYVRDNDPQRDDGNWFSRNVYGNFKAATRWTFAGLQLLPDLAQNVGAEIFSPNDPEGTDGWFKSTNLGTLISNSSQAGEGFFIGGEAAEKQAERARKFRGTINNHAWTIGRGAAQLAFVPGSKPYNVLSGFIDAAVAIGADPTALAGKPIAAARTARATIPGLVGADALTAARALAKGEAGLGSAEQIAFEGTKFGKWVTSDKRAVRLTGQIVDIAKNADLSDEQKVLLLLEKFDYNISPQIASEFARADDGLKVQGLLGEASSRLQGTPDEILLPKDVREIRGATAASAWLDEKAERVPLFRNVRNNRFFSQVPKNQVVINGSGIDKAQAIKNYSNYMKGIGFGPDSDEYKNVMGQVVRAYSLSDPGASRPAVQAAFDNALRVIATKAAGRTGADIDDVWKRMVAAKNAELAKSRVFTVDEIGWADDGGLVQSLLKYFPQEVIDDFPQEALDRLVLTGPGALNELADEVAVLPDFREVRKFAGILSRVSTKQPVEKVNALIESAQNELWKPLALATGGYIMRNMIDAQTRIAMNGMSGLFRHPQDFILWVMNKKGFEDIRGVDFEDVLRTNVEEWGENQREMVDALTFDTYKNLDRPVDAKTNQFRNGNWTEVNQGVDPNAHRIGYVDNLAQIHTDAVNGQISRFDLMGLTEERQTELIIQWLNQPEQAKILESLNRYAKLGLKVGDPENGNVGAVIQLGDNALEDFVAGWVSKLSRMKTSTITRGDKDLQVVAAYNRVPLITTENGVRVIAPVERVNVDDLPIVTDTRPGTILDLGNGKQAVIINRFTKAGDQIDPFSGEVMTDVLLDIQPVFNDVAIDIPVAQFAPEVLGESYGSAELRELLTIKGNQGQLAQFVKRAERGAGQVASRRFGKAGAAADYFVDKFFVGLYGRGTQILEKSPVFRQYYFREILATADELAPDQAQMILSRVLASAEQEGIPAARYVGGKDVLEKLKTVADSVSDATGTVDELDAYAKAVALRETKNLLYNATERSNLEDILRVVIPFGAAWREVLGTYARATIEDPTRIRRAQLIFDGARKFDPDGDGEGFFYKDATTGEYSFNFPLSGWFSQLLTGLDTPLQAPVKRISIGLGVIPSVGPVGQIAYSKIAPDIPSLDFVRGILLPYGEKTTLGFVPKWVSRLNEALEGNTMNLGTVYGNTYIETLRALSTSGEYDLADFNDQEQLYADARWKARIITGMRALGQFFGPTAPSPEFRITTKDGDMYATQLIKEFQKLQANNYDTAVSEFLRIYGNDALLYLSNKTESVAGGLEATEQFGDWERRNGDLLKKYPNVAGFMAPGGDNFSFEVWSRQVTSGKRRRLTDREIVEAAQYRAAASQYRAMRDKLPASPSAEQKAWLRRWRQKLNKEYPGFPVVAEFNPGEFPAKIEELTRMVQESSLADNDVAQATALYLRKRDQALQSAASAGYSSLASNAAAPLRDWLIGHAQAIVAETPEFARIYDRLLAAEIED
jgi:hypothetical protein